MKARHLLILIFLLSTVYAIAQDDTTSLFVAKKIRPHVFLETGSSVIQSYDKAGIDVDVSLNVLLNHTIYVGAAYKQLASNEYFYSLKNSDIELTYDKTTIKYQNLGVQAGYIFFPNQKIISFSPDISIGWVGVNLNTDTLTHKINGAYITPNLKGVFNVSKYFRIGVRFNYSYFGFKKFKMEEDYFISFYPKDLHGIGGGVFFRLGTF